MEDKDKKEEKVEDKEEDAFLDGLFPDEKEDKPEDKEIKADKKEETPAKPQDKKEEKPESDLVKQATLAAEKAAERAVELTEKRIERRQEISEYLSSEDGKIFAKYAVEIRKAALLPNYLGFAMAQIPAMILKPQVYAQTLQDYRDKANKEAAAGKPVGTGARPSATEDKDAVDYWKLPKEEFEQIKQKALRGEYTKGISAS